MPPLTAIAGRTRPGGFLQHPALRDAAFVALALLGVALAYQAAADSPPVATAAVVAIATAAGLHARLAMGRSRAAAQIAACGALLAVMGAAPRLVGVVLVSGLGGAELIARCTRRAAVLRAGGWTAVIAGAASASGLLTVVPLASGDELREALGAAVGGLLSAPIMLAVGPAVEWIFGHTTRLTMGEWLSYDHPLLRDLSSAAPGTFQHSINVGVLADAGVRAIGGDALLARVGGLYHDVGKLRAPEFFVENQRAENPHDGLDPRDSARILRAHVSDGVDLLRSHRMSRIAGFVREHHGTGAMRLLQEKAARLGLDTGEDYRYAGPRPRSRETGVVMIADQLEATARASPPDDEAACERIVRTTIERIVGEDELEESGLSPQDLRTVKPALARALSAMHHRRLTYPPSGTGSPPRGRLAFVSDLFTRGRGG